MHSIVHLELRYFSIELMVRKATNIIVYANVVFDWGMKVQLALSLGHPARCNTPADWSDCMMLWGLITKVRS